MIRIGKYNKLEVKRIVDFGVYLGDKDDGKTEILLPSRYITDALEVGDEIDVFVYNDSEDRLIATTERPFVCVDECAFLQVVDVNKVGAFLDWGLPKNLLVPFKEQKMRMMQGGIYPVFVYLDHTTRRIVASAKIEHFVGNVIPRYKVGDIVDALVMQKTDIGYRVVVDNLHFGMVYNNELFSVLTIGETIKARVKNVRDDGKIDLVVGDKTRERVEVVADTILGLLETSADGRLMLGDQSSPEEIKQKLGCSKKDFKKAIGLLYKDRKIALSPTGIVKL